MDNTYTLLKCLHIFGAVLFLGNLLVTAWWKINADLTNDPKIIAFAQRQVTLTDMVFTGGGALLILFTGVGNAVLHGMDYLQIRWLSWGFWLFVISGIIWLAILIPVQVKQSRLAREFADGKDIPAAYWRLRNIWAVFGNIAIILPLYAVYWMVYKPL